MAAQVDFTAEQNEWYEMADEACPHVTLGIHADHQAKELCPMIKRLKSASDGSCTQIPGLLYSPSENSNKIMHTATNSVVLQHQQIQRFHGREKTDHSDSAQILFCSRKLCGFRAQQVWDYVSLLSQCHMQSQITPYLSIQT